MELINIAGLLLLALLLRKLIWCLRCYYHGKPTPEPISFLPRRSGRTFDEHVRQARAEDEEES